VHTYGYTEGVGFKDVVVPAWAAGFSAFGCACADFEYRYDKSVDLASPSLPATARRPQACAPCSRPGKSWRQGHRRVRHQRLQAKDVMLIPGYKMQYMGQLNDLEIVSPVTSAATADDWEKIVEPSRPPTAASMPARRARRSWASRSPAPSCAAWS
jgi:acetone carboxylase beta subunit